MLAVFEFVLPHTQGLTLAVNLQGESSALHVGGSQVVNPVLGSLDTQAYPSPVALHSKSADFAGLDKTATIAAEVKPRVTPRRTDSSALVIMDIVFTVNE